MSGPIVIIDTSEIREGRLDDLEKAMTELARFVEANEPRAIAYEVYLDEQRSRVTVLQIHPDASSAESHMDVAAPVFRGFADLLVLEGIDVYGMPSEELLSRLWRKARMLGSEKVAVHELHAGFARFQRVGSGACG